jgi:hypothetical protein
MASIIEDAFCSKTQLNVEEQTSDSRTPNIPYGATDDGNYNWKKTPEYIVDRK